MKEVASLNANFLARIPDDEGERFTAEIEVALILSEVGYALNNTGQVVKERKMETLRFVASAAALRTMAKTLSGYADEAETALSEALRDPVNKQP